MYPVNPRADHVDGVRGRRLGAIEGPVDLALVAVPAAQVPGVMESCGKKGVEAGVGTRGLASPGPEGRRHYRRPRFGQHAGSESGYLGPNCLGVINTNPRSACTAD